MEIKQQLRISQKIMMTPELRQAIEVLQMSRMDLAEYVREELLENPVLEDKRDALETRETPEPQSEGQAQKEKDRRDDIDWDEYLANNSLQRSAPSYKQRQATELPSVDQTYSRPDDLTDHLLWQLRMGEFLPEERHFGSLVIGQLEDTGMLRMEGVAPEDIVPRFAREAGLHPEDAEAVLGIMQRFDPVGCCARNLSESLFAQAEELGFDELALTVIRDHIPDLQKRNYDGIAKKLGVEVEEIYDIAQVIKDLDPRPGRNYATGQPHYVTPDVHIRKVAGEYVVLANDDDLPNLHISGYYRSAMAKDPEAKTYIKKKLKSARELLRAIDQRRQTIVRVTECILEKQIDFFENGIDHLKPMILKDVAEAVNLSESTVSRGTSNKYVETPMGVMPLKFFFNSAIKREGAEDIASESVKQAIKKLVEAEDPKKPYSDSKLVKLLAEQDIKIARRTVAKYREKLGILSSSQRKRYF